jgi:hypothetical protein
MQPTARLWKAPRQWLHEMVEMGGSLGALELGAPSGRELVRCGGEPCHD